MTDYSLSGQERLLPTPLEKLRCFTMMTVVLNVTSGPSASGNNKLAIHGLSQAVHSWLKQRGIAESLHHERDGINECSLWMMTGGANIVCAERVECLHSFPWCRP